jgi:hypothetical protein
MDVAVITWCERTNRFSEGAETSCATATKRAVRDRHTTDSLLALSNACSVTTCDVSTAGRVAGLVHVADDFINFARR